MKQFRKEQLELIADVIRTQALDFNGTGEYHTGGKDALNSLAHLLAGSLRTTTPDFDRQRFLASCGLEVEANQYSRYGNIDAFDCPKCLRTFKGLKIFEFHTKSCNGN